MNVETKAVRNDVKEYEKFGWKCNEEKRAGHARHHYREYILVRDKDIPNYDQISSLERKYFSAKSQLQTYEPMDPIYGVVTFLCFIIPFVVYAVFKNNQKKKVEAHNAAVHKRMDGVLVELEKHNK